MSTTFLYWMDGGYPVLSSGEPPENATLLTPEQEEELRAAMSRGDIITQDGDGWTISPRVQTEEEINAARIAELKQFLRDTDYVALPDYDKDKPEILAERQAARDEIRGLET